MINSIRAIALNTFRETVRDKLLYSLIAFALLSIGGTILAGSVSLGEDTRVIESFGLTSILIFQMIITIFIGTQLVWREIERKTVFMVLSKPVSRESFYLGKFLGLCLTLLVTGAIMAAVFLIVLGIKTHHFDSTALLAVIFIIVEAWLLTAIGLLFSAFTTPLASAVYTFCIALIGHSSSSIWTVAMKSKPFLKGVLEFVYYVFPNLEKFNLRNEVIYNLYPDGVQVAMITLYFAAFLVAVLLLGMAAFRRHEF